MNERCIMSSKCMSTLKCTHKHTDNKAKKQSWVFTAWTCSVYCLQKLLSSHFSSIDTTGAIHHIHKHMHTEYTTCNCLKERAGDAGQSAMEVNMLIVYTKWCRNKKRSEICAVMKVFIVRWRILDMTVCEISDVEMNHTTTAFKVHCKKLLLIYSIFTA